MSGRDERLALRDDGLDDTRWAGVSGLRSPALNALLLVALAAGMGLSAAESPAQEATAEAVVPAELDGTKWRLVEIDDRAPDSDLPAVTLSFGSARAEGSGGCNWYAGWLERGAAGRFVVSYLAVTRRDCGHPRIMDQEARYLAAFEGMETYRLNGDELELTASTNRNLVFRPD